MTDFLTACETGDLLFLKEQKDELSLSLLLRGLQSALTFSHQDVLDFLLVKMTENQKHEIFMGAARAGHTPIVDFLFSHVRIGFKDFQFLLTMAKSPHEDIAVRLLPFVEQGMRTAFFDAALLEHRTQTAMAARGCLELTSFRNEWVKYATEQHPSPIFDMVFSLFLESKAAFNFSWVKQAAHLGHADIVERFLPFISDPIGRTHKDIRDEALIASVRAGRHEVARLLLPISDPKTYESRALFHACANQDHEMIDLLWDVSDPKAAFDNCLNMVDLGGNKIAAGYIKKRMQIDHDHAQLLLTANQAQGASDDPTGGITKQKRSL